MGISKARRKLSNNIRFRRGRFANGKDGPGGSIAVAWSVRGWLTTYLIDHEGIIRHKELHEKDIDGPLEKMIVAAE